MKVFKDINNLIHKCEILGITCICRQNIYISVQIKTDKCYPLFGNSVKALEGVV